METVNSQQAQRVWQRVHAPKGEPFTEEIHRLSAGEWEASAACLALARRAGGKFAPALRLLAQNSRSRWACLQGLALLRSGKRPQHTHPARPEGSPFDILSQCCRDGLERIDLYSRSPELPGPLAATLAREQTNDCRALLEILGNWST